MKKNFTKVLILFLVVFSTLNCANNSQKVEEQKVQLTPNNISKKINGKNPCWFVELKENDSWTYEELQERNKRDQLGYPTEIPLKEAIKTFNEERHCYEHFREFPDLTEEEVLSAIVLGSYDSPEEQQNEKRKAILSNILQNKMLPKGSLLEYYNGKYHKEISLGRFGKIHAKDFVISLYLGLDKNDPNEKGSTPGYIFVIRNKFYGFERVD